MDNVFTFDQSPAEAGQWVVVAIGEPNPPQLHIGIMHRDGTANLHFLHLAWNCQLHNVANRPHYLNVWVVPDVPVKRQRVIAAFCRRVWRKNGRGGIPYAFSRPHGAFDSATGAFLIGPTRFGLTCASFVLAVFHAVGLQLADYESWPVDRHGDREWQQSIINQLEAERAEQTHINHLREEIGAIRFRPEEVAASTAQAPPPVAFEQAHELGRQVLSKLRG